MALEPHLWRFAVHTGVQSCNTKALQHWQGRKDSPLFTAALQNRLTKCLCHWNHTCGDLLFIQGCSDAAPKHCSTGRAEKTPHCSVLLCKTGPQQACGAEITPMEICSSYRGAVMQHQSTAALAGPKRLPTVHCCFAKQADSMFMPLESHLWRFAVHAGVQWQGRKDSPLFTAALQNRLTACSCHWNHTCGDLLFMQVCSDATPKHCSTGQGRKASPLFTAALWNRLTACLCHWNHTYGYLLFIQGCSDAAPKHCSTGQGRKASPLFTAALWNRPTACMCHWSHTYGDLLFSYRGAVMQHQSTAALVRAEKLPHCSLLLCKTGPQHACATAVTPMEICSSYRGAVMQHQSTAALAGQKRLPTVHCCSAKQADSMLVPLESHLWRFAVHAGVQ